MQNKMIWLLVVFFGLGSAGCKGKDKGNTPVPVFIGRPTEVKTPLANWLKRDSRIALSLEGGVLDLDEEEAFRTELGLTFKLFFRDFARRSLGTNAVGNTPENILHRYETLRGLPADHKFLSADHVREIIYDVDIMEEYWDGRYAMMSPAGDVYPQPHEMKEAAKAGPDIYSATSMSFLLQLQAAGRAMIPEAHRQAIGLLTIDFLPHAYGIYVDSGWSPRPPQEEVNGMVVLALDVLGLYPEDNFGLYVFLHENGHAVDFRVFVDDASGIDTSESYYDISWKIDEEFSWFWDRRLPSGDASDAITGYSKTNPWEDFAEHYSYFIIHPDTFRTKVKDEWKNAKAETTAARANIPIFRKYWMMWVALGQREYGTPDADITAVLETMPKAWPAPPALPPDPFGGFDKTAARGRTSRCPASNEAHCLGIPR